MIFGEGSERKQLERGRRREAGALATWAIGYAEMAFLSCRKLRHTLTRRSWDFQITGLVVKSVRITWDAFTRLPMKEVTADMHCVT